MYEKYPVYAKGSIVNIVDRVEPTIKTLCTIKAIEQDDIDRTLYFYFLFANDESLNTKFDPQVGYYFDYLEHCNPRTEFVAQATLS